MIGTEKHGIILVMKVIANFPIAQNVHIKHTLRLLKNFNILKYPLTMLTGAPQDCFGEVRTSEKIWVEGPRKSMNISDILLVCFVLVYKLF